MSSKNQLHSVFFFRNQLPQKTKPAKVVKAVCSIVNVTEVDTVQSIDGFYRIDVKNTKAQRALLLKGITVEGLFFPLMDGTESRYVSGSWNQEDGEGPDREFTIYC